MRSSGSLSVALEHCVNPSAAVLHERDPQGMPSQEVQMQVIDALAGIGSLVDDEPIPAVSNPLLARDLRSHADRKSVV